jgi:hypothetical protein
VNVFRASTTEDAVGMRSLSIARIAVTIVRVVGASVLPELVDTTGWTAG